MLTNFTKMFSGGEISSTPYDTWYNIFLWLSSVLIVMLSLPQLYKIIKDKKTGNISFLSFWIFHIGILGWVIYGATNPHNLYNVVVADGTSIFVNGVMTYLLYHYKKDFTKKQKIMGAIGVAITWVVAIIFIILFVYDQKTTGAKLIQLPDKFSTIFGIIFPAFTTFAFAPQLIKSFKTKKWQGVSIWMFVIYEVNNIVWIIWWILGISKELYVNPGQQPWSLIAGLIWQFISLTIFGVQLAFTLYDRHLIKTGRKIE